MRNIKTDQHNSDHRSSELVVNVEGSSSWKYSQGARSRQRLFNISEDIRSMSKRIKDDSDHIPDPTQSSSSQQRKLSASRSILQNKSIEEIHLFQPQKLQSVSLHKTLLLQDPSQINSNTLISGSSLLNNEVIKKFEINSSNILPFQHPIYNAMSSAKKESPKKESPKRESPQNGHMQSIQLMRGSSNGSILHLPSEQEQIGGDESRQQDESKQSPLKQDESPYISRSHYYEDNESNSPIKLLRSTTKLANNNMVSSSPGKSKDPLILRGLSIRQSGLSQRQSGTDNHLFSSQSPPPGGASNVLSHFVSKMKISQLTRRFIAKISQFSQKYNYLHLSKKHFDIIGDPASSVSTAQQNANTSNSSSTSHFLCSHLKIFEYFSAFMQSLEDQICKINPLNPESRFSILCDIAYGLVLLGYLYVVPIQLSFQVSFFWFDQFVFAVFLANFLITLNKAYYAQGIMITDRKMILRHFVKTQLFIDILVFVTLQIDSFQFVAFLKFFDINKIVKRADNHFQMIRKYPIAFTLINLVLKMTLMAQIAGCAFHYVAHVEIQNGQTDTWLAQKGVQNETWQNRYIISIYFSFITMMTIGFGDVTPVNNTERIYVIFMTLLSSGIFGYVVNTIGELYMQQRQKIEQFQKRKQEITVYMDTRNIDSLSKLKVLNYLEYAFQYKKKKDSDAQALFQDIPQTLVNEIYQKYFGKYLFENKIMRLNFSEKCLRALALCMKEKNVAPNEYLFYRGERGSTVYFLASGNIDIVIENQNIITTISTVQKHGDEIGMRSAFIDSERSTSAKCQKDQTCTLVYFDMADFKSIMVKFQKDFERYSELRDDIIFNNHTLDTKCPSCMKYDHQFIFCPLINFNAPVQNLIARCQSSFEHIKREDHQRKKFSYRTISMTEETRQKLRIYRISLVQLIMPDIRENIPEFKNRSDKFFFDKVPTVRILETSPENEGEMEEYNIYEDYDETMMDDRRMNNDVEFEENDEDDDDEDDDDDDDESDTEHLKFLFQQQLQQQQQQQSQQQSNFQSQQNSTFQQSQQNSQAQYKRQQSNQQSQQQQQQLQGIQEDDRNHLGNSGEQLQQPGDSNVVQTSTYSSNNQGNLVLTQLQPGAITTNPATQLSSNQGRDSFQSQNMASPLQKISFFSKKQLSTQDNIQLPPNASASPLADNMSQRNTGVNQLSARTLSFRRERGDSFLPPIRGQKSQYGQQRSLQSKVRTNRKASEIQISFKPSSNNNQSSTSLGGGALQFGQPGQQGQQNFAFFILDFDKMKIFEKYFPQYNYPVIIGRMQSRKKTIAGVSRGRKGFKTIVISPSRRKSHK